MCRVHRRYQCGSVTTTRPISATGKIAASPVEAEISPAGSNVTDVSRPLRVEHHHHRRRHHDHCETLHMRISNTCNKREPAQYSQRPGILGVRRGKTTAGLLQHSCVFGASRFVRAAETVVNSVKKGERDKLLNCLCLLHATPACCLDQFARCRGAVL